MWWKIKRLLAKEWPTPENCPTGYQWGNSPEWATLID